MSASARHRAATAALAVCCAAALVLVALSAGSGGGAGGARAGSETAETSAPAIEGSDPETGGEPLADASPDGAEGDATAETFLMLLEEGRDGSDRSAPVVWIERRGIAEVAADVVGAYRDLGSPALATSGYLDLSGNVWGALLVDAEGWADMVTVMEDGSGERTTVRVVRLWTWEVDDS